MLKKTIAGEKADYNYGQSRELGAPGISFFGLDEDSLRRESLFSLQLNFFFSRIRTAKKAQRFSPANNVKSEMQKSVLTELSFTALPSVCPCKEASHRRGTSGRLKDYTSVRVSF